MIDDDEQIPSKSRKKREHHALQELAEALAGLSSGELEQIPLSDDLRDAVKEASGLKRGSLQRQVRYIAKRLAMEDATEVGDALERLRHGGREETARHHRIERWRDRLLAEGRQALSEFLDAHPHTDRQQLRQLIRNARLERERGQPPKAFRKLYALLRGQVD
ncbi:MAG TPA: ribosome biogenesis factor YjgA [Gammaproteobacteria bacterium]|nr:ribosome biogenesis factor YjgA [Gammaproteobacteria bacterium]